MVLYSFHNNCSSTIAPIINWRKMNRVSLESIRNFLLAAEFLLSLVRLHISLPTNQIF